MVQHFTEKQKLSCVDNFLWLNKNLKFMQLEMQIREFFKKIISDKNNLSFQMFWGIRPKSIKFWLWKGTIHFYTLSIEV